MMKDGEPSQSLLGNERTPKRGHLQEIVTVYEIERLRHRTDSD